MSKLHPKLRDSLILKAVCGTSLRCIVKELEFKWKKSKNSWVVMIKSMT